MEASRISGLTKANIRVMGALRDGGRVIQSPDEGKIYLTTGATTRPVELPTLEKLAALGWVKLVSPYVWAITPEGKRQADRKDWGAVARELRVARRSR